MHNIVTEGYMPFMGYHTYYRIVGEASEKAPLLLLHGGPGSTHNYFEVLDRIAKGAVRLAETVQIGKGREKERWHSTAWGFRNPGLLNKLDVDEVELILPVPSPKSNSTGVSEGVSNRVPNGVSDTAKAIYSHIQADPNISRNELVNLTGISLKNVQKHINRLKELGLIRRIGSTRLGYWEIIEWNVGCLKGCL